MSSRMYDEYGRLVERTRPENWESLTAQERAYWDMGLESPREPTDSDPLAALRAQEAEERRKRGEPHGLTADEVEGADKFGMNLARYAALKNVRNVDDFEALERAERDR